MIVNKDHWDNTAQNGLSIFSLKDKGNLLWKKTQALDTELEDLLEFPP